MNTSALVYLGIGGHVVALHRDTGEQAWATPLKGGDFVNVAVEGEKVIATCHGEAFCLDALSGKQLWHNRLKGRGTGLAAIATADTVRATLVTVLAEKHRRDQAAAAAGTVAAAG